jgi:tRNA G18 (ribose-2'-O)-methylase SpoU
MRKLLNEELERLSAEEFKKSSKLRAVVVLDNIRSAHNTGSVFRTCDAFRIEKIFLCGITATPPHREIHKTALGATESVQWEYYSDTLKAVQDLKAEGYRICALEQTDRSINLMKFTPAPDTAYALIFGNEMRGVDQAVIEQCDMALEIPQYGTKHSLNVSVSVGVTLWEFFRHLQDRIT